MYYFLHGLFLQHLIWMNLSCFSCRGPAVFLSLLLLSVPHRAHWPPGGLSVRLTCYQAAEITLQTWYSHANDQCSFWVGCLYQSVTCLSSCFPIPLSCLSLSIISCLTFFNCLSFSSFYFFLWSLPLFCSTQSACLQLHDHVLAHN